MCKPPPPPPTDCFGCRGVGRVEYMWFLQFLCLSSCLLRSASQFCHSLVTFCKTLLMPQNFN